MSRPPALAGFVLFVRDIDRSKEFYQDILGQEIALDLGINVGFRSGLALWQREYAENVIFGKHSGTGPEDTLEIYFETDRLSGIREDLRNKGVPFVHDIREQPWGQRAFRIRDPDTFIIEIGEPMDFVILRMREEGLSEEDIVKKTTMPAELVHEVLSAG